MIEHRDPRCDVIACHCGARHAFGRPPSAPRPAAGPACRCWRCLEARGERTWFWFAVVCPTCGHHRCPHANDHANACRGTL
ncbi:MAG: hypothetical protein ACOYY2_02950 [Actinomycetota bacterium]